MIVLVDTREQQPWTFEGQRGMTTKRQRLDAGDYSVEGLEHRVSIERKSLPDWISTVINDRARFYKELELLRSYEVRMVIIEAGVREIMTRQYRQNVEPDSIMGFIAEVNVGQRVQVQLGGSRAEAQILAGYYLRMAAKKLSREPSNSYGEPA